jgi:hypothetical protein
MDGPIRAINFVLKTATSLEIPNFSPNNERPELCRVQDVRAALPQNCSIARLDSAALLANGTPVPIMTPKVPLG